MAYLPDDLPDDIENDDDDEEGLLPPLELLAPASENIVIIRCPDEPLHITAEDAIELGIIVGIEDAEILLVESGETDVGHWVLIHLYTVDDAVEEWETHLANIRRNAVVVRQTPTFSMEQIADVRTQRSSYAYVEMEPPVDLPTPPEWTLSSEARLLATRRRQTAQSIDEEYADYDQVLCLMVPDAVITTDSARAAIRQLIEEELPDIATHGPVVDDYVVPEGLRTAQKAYLNAEAVMVASETREEYLNNAALRDAIWLESIAPLMLSLNATRIIDDAQEREIREETMESYHDDILMDREPLPYITDGLLEAGQAATDNPEFMAADEELRTPLRHPEKTLAALESHPYLLEEIPELMLTETIITLRALVQTQRD